MKHSASVLQLWHARPLFHDIIHRSCDPQCGCARIGISMAEQSLILKTQWPWTVTLESDKSPDPECNVQGRLLDSWAEA